MRTQLIKIAACALAIWLTIWLGAPVSLAALDCPTGQCPLPARPLAPPATEVPVASNLEIDARPIARIENTLGTGRIFGTGTLVDTSNRRGLVVTCAHLFRDGVGSVRVAFPNKPYTPGQVLKVDAAADLAAIAIAAPAIVPVEIADQAPQRGDPLISCGYGSDGRLWCNRGQTLGYVFVLGGHGHETLELSGTARQGDSGGPVFNDQHQLVGVLFGTNGRVVDATYCGRVRAFLADLVARFGGRAGEPTPGAERSPNESQPNQNQTAPTVPNDDAAGPLIKLPPRIRRPKQSPADEAESTPLDRAAGAAESAANAWLSAKATALLVSVGVPGGLAGLAGGALVWLVMRRGKRRLQTQLDGLRERLGTSASDAAPAATAPTTSSEPAKPSVVERHHNRYVPYEASSVDRAWAAAHARVSERYPGAVPYLKIVEGVKDQLLSGIDEPQLS